MVVLLSSVAASSQTLKFANANGLQLNESARLVQFAEATRPAPMPADAMRRISGDQGCRRDSRSSPKSQIIAGTIVIGEVDRRTLEAVLKLLARQAAQACPGALLPFDAEPNPEITVLVYNHAPAPGDILAAAEREADRIFSRAGVRVNWFDCSEGRGDSAAVCLEGWGDTNIGLRVVATPMENPRRRTRVIDDRQEEPLGFAVYPDLASVYYDYRARFGGDERALGLPMILGCAIAHELGHLLLGPNRHSTEGVMLPEWSPRQFRLARMRELSFTQEESCAIRTAARRRMANPTRQR
jgi:hypothetical protein